MVSSLKVVNLRNIRHSLLSLGPGVTLLSGANGAGKTALIEAIFLLGRGRSFRGNRSGDITTEGERETLIEGVVRGVGDAPRRWVFRRLAKSGVRTVDGIPVKGSSGLRFPVRLVGENPQGLLEGDPSIRRRFLDWNAFHVEPGFGPAWARFRRALEQRNAWLKGGALGRAIWDQEYLVAAMDLHALRQRFVGALEGPLGELCTEFPFSRDVRLHFYPGWPLGQDLEKCLMEDFEVERKLGFTRVGPARADFSFSRLDKATQFSRGQQKILVGLLQLAARSVDVSAPPGETVWLVDDVGSDLDGSSRSRLVEMLSDTGDQSVITLVAERPVDVTDIPCISHRFHVERGDVRSIDPF